MNISHSSSELGLKERINRAGTLDELESLFQAGLKQTQVSPATKRARLRAYHQRRKALGVS